VDECKPLMVGRKRVVMFPPTQSARLSPFQAANGPPRCSQINLVEMRAGSVKHDALFPEASAAEAGAYIRPLHSSA